MNLKDENSNAKPTEKNHKNRKKFHNKNKFFNAKKNKQNKQNASDNSSKKDSDLKNNQNLQNKQKNEKLANNKQKNKQKNQNLQKKKKKSNKNNGKNNSVKSDNLQKNQKQNNANQSQKKNKNNSQNAGKNQNKNNSQNAGKSQNAKSNSVNQNNKNINQGAEKLHKNKKSKKKNRKKNKQGRTKMNEQNINNNAKSSGEQTPAAPVFKKRVFSENEQNSGTYNVGMRKNPLTNNAQSGAGKSKNPFTAELPTADMVRERILNKLEETNPRLNFESMEQGELLAKDISGEKSKKVKKSEKVKVIFLGGIGEIGKNITALECGDDMILIDCGLAFPSEDMPGIDLVIPDFSYVKENASKLRGIVITHGHEDHIGSLPYLLKDVKAPIYGSEITLTLIDNKVREHKLTGVKGICVRPGYVVKLGCFKVEFVKVNHSIPGAFALNIETVAGNIFHTGDFKIDYEPIDGEVIDLSRIAEIGRKGVNLLLCESTNVERPGYTMSEKRVGENLERIFIENATRRLFVATFSSNLYRVSQIVDLAIKYNRRVAVIGRSMINNIDAGLKIGAFKFNKNVFIDVEKIGSLEDKNVLVLSTGSQGEPNSALSRLANGEFSKVEIGENDTIIFSSSPIPGNENMINNVINNLYKKGAIVVDENVHASGHACQEELKLIHTLLNPKFFIPVHGEFRHLKEHVDLSKKLGMSYTHCLIPEIGNVVELSKTSMVMAGRVQAGEQLVDGLGIGDSDSVVLKDRKQLSEDGLVIVVMGVSDASGELVSEPYLITRGFVYADEAEKLCEEAKGVLHDTLELLDLRSNKDYNELRNMIRKPLRNFFYKKTMRTPMILPIIYRV